MKIEIYDQIYNVNADGNEDYLRELAAYVDGKMRSVADATHMVDSLKVAVLAALNIADETLRHAQTPAGNRRAAAQARGKMRLHGGKGARADELAARPDSDFAR